MATRIELPKDITKALIEQGISLRNRQIKQAINSIIKEALEKEVAILTIAGNTLQEIK